MNIDVTFDSSVNSAPAAFTSAVDYVVQYYDSLFTNPVTINIDVGYGEIDGQPLGSGDLGESDTFLDASVSYTQLRNALIAERAPGSSTLPTTSPTTRILYMATAEAQALGLLPATSSTLNGYVGFSSSAPFSYTPGVTEPNEYYFIGAVEHEMSEVMGRKSYLDLFNTSSFYSPMDLFRYSASGVRQFTTGAASYFSINSGTTDLDNWNNFVTGNLGDLGDWAPSAGNDAFDDNGSLGIVSFVSQTDLTLMSALGWEETSGAVATAPLSGANLTFGAIGDFNGNGLSDILWDSSAGAPTIWLMNGTNVSSGATLPAIGNDWQIVGAADFNGNGDADILLENSAGTPVIWLMNGTSIVSGAALPTVGNAWQIVGLADFTGNGDADILFENSGGTPAIWLMNGTTITSGAALPTVGPSWQILGAADFSGDGKAGILFENSAGTPAIWLMNGTNIVSGAALPTVGAAWRFVGTGDFNGDGKSDILWQDSAGTPAIWLMNGTNIIGGAALPNPGLSWQIVGIGDFNGDGKSDILWEDSSGTLAIWFMNGTQVANGEVITANGNQAVIGIPPSGGGGSSPPPPPPDLAAETIGSGTTLALSAPFAGSVTFADDTGTLQLNQSSMFTGQIAGFGPGDTLDLTALNFSADATSASFAENAANTGGTLTVTNGSATMSLALLGQYSASQFVPSSDGSGGTNIIGLAPQSAELPLANPLQHS